MRATPTVIASPTRSRTSRAQPGGDLHRRAGDPPQPADVEERLVDRDPLDERCRVVEHGEHGPAGVGVGLEAGRHDDGAGAQPQRLVAAHRRAHAERLGLVAGREHDAAADDDRPPAQRRIVALLDRREERVEVGVEDGGIGAGHGGPCRNTCSQMGARVTRPGSGAGVRGAGAAYAGPVAPSAPVNVQWLGHASAADRDRWRARPHRPGADTAPRPPAPSPPRRPRRDRPARPRAHLPPPHGPPPRAVAAPRRRRRADRRARRCSRVGPPQGLPRRRARRGPARRSTSAR